MSVLIPPPFSVQEVPADQQDQPAEAEQCPLQFREHHARLHSTYLSRETRWTGSPSTLDVPPIGPDPEN